MPPALSFISALCSEDPSLHSLPSLPPIAPTLLLATRRKHECISPPGRPPRYCDHFDLIRPTDEPLVLGEIVRIHTSILRTRQRTAGTDIGSSPTEASVQHLFSPCNEGAIIEIKNVASNLVDLVIECDWWWTRVDYAYVRVEYVSNKTVRLGLLGRLRKWLFCSHIDGERVHIPHFPSEEAQRPAGEDPWIPRPGDQIRITGTVIDESSGRATAPQIGSEANIADKNGDLTTCQEAEKPQMTVSSQRRSHVLSSTDWQSLTCHMATFRARTSSNKFKAIVSAGCRCGSQQVTGCTEYSR